MEDHPQERRLRPLQDLTAPNAEFNPGLDLTVGLTRMCRSEDRFRVLRGLQHAHDEAGAVVLDLGCQLLQLDVRHEPFRVPVLRDPDQQPREVAARIEEPIASIGELRAGQRLSVLDLRYVRGLVTGEVGQLLLRGPFVLQRRGQFLPEPLKAVRRLRLFAHLLNSPAFPAGLETNYPW
jgi:hypothetical protein